MTSDFTFTLQYQDQSVTLFLDGTHIGGVQKWVCKPITTLAKTPSQPTINQIKRHPRVQTLREIHRFLSELLSVLDQEDLIQLQCHKCRSPIWQLKSQKTPTKLLCQECRKAKRSH